VKPEIIAETEAQKKAKEEKRRKADEDDLKEDEPIEDKSYSARARKGLGSIFNKGTSSIKGILK